MGMLNYASIFPPANKTARELLVSKTETLKDIQEEVRILNDIINVNTMKLKDDNFKQIIMSRFGSVENFVEAVLDIENYIDETSTTDMNEIDDLLK